MRILLRPAFLVSFLLLAVAARATIGISLQMQLGNPSSATADPNNRTRYLIQRAQYALDYNDTLREPNWVAWNLTSTDVGSSGRSPDFFVDTSLPAGFYQVLTTDYSGSGFDRGHMTPSGDRTVSRADNDATFLMSNMIPQAPDNNQGVWASFETYCRTLAGAGNELLIISGPSGFAGSSIASGVAIPGHTWKIAVVVPLGSGTAASRITAATRVIALKIPNIAGIRNNPWQNYITSAAQIESDTGYTFFTDLASDIRAALRVVVDGQSATGSPAIVTQPAGQSAPVGGNASFTVSASGNATLTYQWFKGDDDIPGATTATLALTNVQAADAATYTVVITNGVGSVTSAGATLVLTGIAPSITTPPPARIAAAGSTVTFTVTAAGSPTLAYQWRKGTTNLVNGGNVSGATTATLLLSNVQAGDAATDYNVVVTNSVSSATSANAALTVNAAAPFVVTPPAAQSVTTGSPFTLTVVATGTAPLAYQWRKDTGALVDGGNIAGATTASLTVSNAQAADAGSYDVVVTNGVNPAATSAAAAVTVSTASAPATVTWDFSAATPTSGLPADVTGGTVTQNNNNGTTTMITTTSASSGYTDATGTSNAGAAARIGALNTAASGSAYFELTLTPAAGKQLNLSALTFGTRSTSTGPQAYSIFTSVDNYATAVATGAISNNSSWTLKSHTFTNLISTTGSAVTLRLYGHSGTGSPGTSTANWRIDDLKITLNTVVAPPTAPALLATTPAAAATGVAVTSPITLTFNQAVTVAGSWFSITSALNGNVAATVTGGPSTFTLTPPVSFANSDTVNVTVVASQISDSATGLLHPASNQTFSFTTVTPVAPTIVTHPQPQAVIAGYTASFSVTASGTAPLSYQWRKNGAPITGNGSATSPTLVLTNVQAGDVTNYDVVVSNGVNPAATSNPAALTLSPGPTSIITWDFATATPTSGLPGELTGAAVTQGNNNGTTSLLSTTSVSGSYTGATAGNNAGAAARIGPLNQGASGSAYFELTLTPSAGQQLRLLTLSFGSRSTGTGPQAYGVFTSFDNYTTPIATGTFLNNSAWVLHTPQISSVMPATGTALTLRIYGYNGTGSPSVNTANWRIDDLKVGVTVPLTAPVITTQPLAQTVFAGQTVSLSVATGGSSATPSYQWRRGGNAISGATGTTLALGTVFIEANGNYDVVVTNTAGSTTSNTAAVTVVKRAATIAFGNLSQTYDGTPRPVTATSNPSFPLAIAYAGSATPPVNAGSYAVTASVEDPFYSGTATGTLVVAKVPQTIDNVAPSAAPVVGVSLTVAATASSGLPVTLSLLSGNATISGRTVTPLDTGRILIGLTQAGNVNYLPVSTELALNPTAAPARQDQTITFAALADRTTTAAPFTLSATASSGLPVAFELVSGPASLAGATVTLAGTPGIVVLRATQSGSAAFNAAPPVERSLAITRASYAGFYSGTLGNGGSFALIINADNTGVFLAFAPGSRTAYVSRAVTVDASGRFRFVVTTTGGGTTAASGPGAGAPPVAAAVDDLVLEGTISAGGAITGASTTGAALTLSGNQTANTGGPAATAGFYQAGAAGSSATTLAIVNPAGQALIITQSGNTVDGGTGQVDATGRVSVTTAGQQTIAATFSAENTALNATVTTATGATTTFAGVAASSAAAAAQRVVNISTRTTAGTGDQVAIVGFVIAGTESKTVLVRGVGPALRTFGVTTALASPRLELMRSGSSTPLATNSGWSAAANSAELAAAASRSGAFALAAGSADAALIATLSPGTYTAVVTAATGQAGVALVEVYDLSDGFAAQRLANLSTRAAVGTGDSTLIAGVVVTGSAPKRVLIRAAGPSLAQFSVSGVLARPQLTLFSGTTTVATNTGWSTSADASAIAEAALRTGAFAFGASSADAALILNLAPGAYTAQVTGVNNTTGIALVEIYELP